MVKYLQNRIAIYPLSNEILNFRPFSESAVGKIVIETNKYVACYDVMHYLSIICTSDCRARSKLSDKSAKGQGCNVDFMMKKMDDGRRKISVSVTDQDCPLDMIEIAS